MKLSNSVKALLATMVSGGHGMPDYIDRVGRTEETVIYSHPLSGAAGEAGYKEEEVEWAELYAVTGSSPILDDVYRKVNVAVRRRTVYQYGKEQAPGSWVHAVDLSALDMLKSVSK